ncbi:uncharacterized protein LOC141639441 [Silene latifolia]|uniref:uncharacterized protein LOC141639441 n=1 Tax=Silene latifolia TaxID=37657 RepID=UPI003D76AFE5
MDLQKAYDSIEWNFLEQMLTILKFPDKFKKLVMVVMFATQKWHFRYHPLCRSLKVTHLLFADDLPLFCKGDTRLIMLMLRAFSTFSATSGLIVNVAKSEVVFAGISDVLKHDILQISGFQEGRLSFKYLEIPIQSGRLTRQDYNILMERIVTRASIFLIPKMIIRKIVAICRNYLWDGGTEYHRAPLVAWSTICCNKKSGGLVVKDAEKWNIATVGKHVNWIYTKADRLWVQWIDHIYMKGNDQSVSDRRSIPKHAFIAWLVYHKALNTREKLYAIGICDSANCWLQLKLHYDWKHSQLQQHVCRMAKLACWYNIWMERNKCRLDLQLTMLDGIVKDVKKLIHARVNQMIMQPVTNFDQKWLTCLDILF